MLAGLGFGLGLIVAIGAQNAYVLRQGIRREHVGVVVAVCRALRPAALTVSADGGERTRIGSVVLAALALTWLNPHVYLDTVVLLGSISATYARPWLFGLGAALASLTWFAGLGYGARLLAPVFARPGAWRPGWRPGPGVSAS